MPNRIWTRNFEIYAGKNKKKVENKKVREKGDGKNEKKCIDFSIGNSRSDDINDIR